MLSNTLNTNEIKDSTGAEVEFTRLSTGEGRRTEFAKIGETPALEHRLTIAHQETGSSLAKRRRSVVRIDKDVTSTIDATKTVTVTSYMVVDLPIGAMAANTEFANVIAEIMSFVATTGAGTTVLYNCTGNGADVLLNGGL